MLLLDFLLFQEAKTSVSDPIFIVAFFNRRGLESYCELLEKYLISSVFMELYVSEIGAVYSVF